MCTNRIVYKTVENTSLHLDIFTPPGHTTEQPRPAIVYFHGGGWSGGSPQQFHPHCEHLAARGMVAISAEYRLTGKHGTSPRECVKDGKSAVRWIRAHADELGISPAMLAAGGGSAGAHVAAATATLDNFNEEGDDLSVSCIPSALVLFNPVYDNGPSGWGHDRVKDYWRDISPMHNIHAATPPTVVLLGTHDHLVPVETAKAYKKSMEEKACRCDLYLYEDQTHGFFNAAFTANYEQTIADMDRFLESLGYIKSQPNSES